MTDEQKKLLKQLHKSGCTDSDIEDFCEEHNVSRKEAFRFVAELIAPRRCKGCKYIGYRSIYPCNACSRARVLKDHYEAEHPNWILKDRIVQPEASDCLVNKMGEERRKVHYVYECPHCHKTYECTMTNKMTFRKCRYCNKAVSPYRGKKEEYVWVLEEKHV